MNLFGNKKEKQQFIASQRQQDYFDNPILKLLVKSIKEDGDKWEEITEGSVFLGIASPYYDKYRFEIKKVSTMEYLGYPVTFGGKNILNCYDGMWDSRKYWNEFERLAYQKYKKMKDIRDKKEEIKAKQEKEQEMEILNKAAQKILNQ